ncbi:DUF4199 domain-containing protein [Cellulophaga tyrosinoxydans]|uniref:DUF4199 domain-containing protein n=1 Tax=Cellulophaga tyrosinoxydans TaxID=504486 RepID=A0A1W2CPA9_9FLAO|nr:DUF4199 domain-containing protein [Cellulophaga tyrosinoxydans]SMC87043.1 Protein of unknown function [Cellulophaga tyrosinoxydans]
MEEKRPTTGKFGLIYGVIAAGIGIVFTFMLMAGDMLYDQSPVKNIVQILIFVGVVIAAIYNFRKANNGFLTIKKALGIGFIASLVTAILSIAFTYILANFIEPDFWDKFSEIVRVAIEESNPNLTPEQVEGGVSMQIMFFYPMILIFNLFIGFITALITGLILKKSENLD